MRGTEPSVPCTLHGTGTGERALPAAEERGRAAPVAKKRRKGLWRLSSESEERPFRPTGAI